MSSTAGSMRVIDWLLAGSVLAIATFLIFQNLSAPAIRQWDEAIYANNALDMYMTGDPIVLRRSGEITLYNTKPPLGIWMQALSLHVFGVNEFAIRFPSAIATVLTCVLILIFSIISLKNIRIGVVAVLVLTTSYGYMKQHVVKTGDLDAMLVFWTTGYTLLFLHFLLTHPEQYKKIFTWMGIGIVGAFLTKGIAGMIPLSGLFVCALIAGKAKWILSKKHTYFIGVIVLLLCIGYYVLRESMAPGFFTRTAKVDFGRFLTQTMSWHHQPWYYYFWNWQRLEFFTPYVYWLPVAIIIGLVSKVFRTPVLLLTIHALVFVGILSYPIVKLMWYDAPVYPLLALISAIGLIIIWDHFAERIKITGQKRTPAFIGLLAVLFFLPIKNMYQRNADLRLPVDILEREGHFVRELNRTSPDIKTYKILMLYEQNAHYTQIDFYINAYNRHKEYAITLLRDTSLVQVGDTIACCQEKQIEWLKSHFAIEEIQRNETGCLIGKVSQK